MKSETVKEEFLQFKIDFIQFLTQIYEKFGYEPHFTGVLFSLLMEEQPLSINDIFDRTLIKKSLIKKVITDSNEVYNPFTIYKTKKREDSKNDYYYISVKLEEYINQQITTGIDIIKFNVDFIPELIARVDAVKGDKTVINSLRKSLVFFYTFFTYYVKIIKELNNSFGSKLEDFLASINKINVEIKNSVLEIPQNINFDPKDTVNNIKRDFIAIIRSWEEITVKIGKTKLPMTPALVIYAIWLENEPTTQEKLMDITTYSRATISEVLKKLSNQGIVASTRNFKTKRKYFSLNNGLEGFIKIRLEGFNHFYKQVYLMSDKKFLPELEELEVSTKEKNELKNFILRLSELFRISVTYFEAIVNNLEYIPEIGR